MSKKTSDNVPTIGIDLLGSDSASKEVLQACLPFLEKLQDQARFVFFSEEKNIPFIPPSSYLSYIVSSEEITMEDDPLPALRKKRNSSIALGMKALKEGEIDAFVSMGSTGALLAGGAIELKTLPGVKRPALLTTIPTSERQTALLDVGGNTDCSPEQLLGFAAMGIAYKKARGVSKPTVGLLNIGKEATKGNAVLKETYAALQKISDNFDYPLFQGNIEANEAFSGAVDVLVTDGITGNVLLKGAEGIAGLIFEKTAPFAPKDLQAKFDSNKYPGATLCGVAGIVIKCHGGADPSAIGHALPEAIDLVKKQFLDGLHREISSPLFSSF